MKRLLPILCAIGLLGSMSGCAKSDPVTVYDAQGAVIATLDNDGSYDKQLDDPTQRDYITYAVQEAINTLAAQRQCTTTEAKKLLFREGYSLHTSFDPTAHAALDTMVKNHAQEQLAVGCAIIGYDGGIRAIYSGGDESYALMQHSPFSTIKPLSVYAPAIENGVADWSTRITDMPYKQLADADGRMKDWPVNPSQGYTYQPTTLLECIKQSLNTTAVHCLKSIGVENSIKFLQETFGINLNYEQNKLTVSGEDEVLGNVALGYFYTGITPIDLAGYYQIFGNKGQYTAPHALVKITDRDGTAIVTHKSETKQVIREDTAYIMNRLLNAVTSPGGTGAKAKVPDAELIGKTGTGNDEGGNWFVGVTPEYTCAIWHGYKEKTGNIAASLFTEVAENMPAHTQTKFPASSAVRKGVYCSQSGKLYSPSCSQMQIGYYASDRKPSVCDAH